MKGNPVMTFLARRRPCSHAGLWTLLLSSLLASAPVRAQSVPSQLPLLNQGAKGVAPNIMLTVDVSASMNAQNMPEGDVVLPGLPGIAPPPAKYGLVPLMNPGDEPLRGTVPTHVAGGWAHRFLRSPETNSIYYNPQVRYLPWAKADGSRFPNAVPTKVPLDPVDTTRGTVNLTFRGDLKASWCLFDQPGAATSPPASVKEQCPDATRLFSAAIYFRLKRPNGAYANPRQEDSYDVFDINDTAKGTPVFEKFRDRVDCAGAQCTQQEELANFANWFAYHRSRMLLAKAALGEVLSAAPTGFRLGYGHTDRMARKTVDGIDLRIVESGVRDFDEDRRKVVMDWVYGLKAVGTSTPLRLAIQEVGTYYQSKLNTGPWSPYPGDAGRSGTLAHLGCRRAFHLLVTDGYWNDAASDGLKDEVKNADGSAGPAIRDGFTGKDWRYEPVGPYQDKFSDTLADYAFYYWSRDLNDKLANLVPPSKDDPATWQHMVNFMVGLGVRGSLDPKADLPALTEGSKPWTEDKIDDLWHAAVNSHGAYFSASNSAELVTAMQQALRSALERPMFEAGAATAGAKLESGARKYTPSYQSGEWSGDVQAFALDASGNVSDTPLWSARAMLPAWPARKIFTWDAGLAPAKGVAFEWAKLSFATQSSFAPEARSASFVNFIRGDRSNEDSATGWRERTSALGDFVNSAPLFVKGGRESGHQLLPDDLGTTYETWLLEKAKRPGMLYVGGNDGMLHAFRDTQGATGNRLDGVEVFAYVPNAVIPNLNVLGQRNYGSATNYHRFFVDGPLREADVYLPPPSGGPAAWRNYLFGSAGAGARTVFALDITNPEAMDATSVRWEVNAASQPELGHVLAPVASGQLPSGQWVALFGNGFGGRSGKPYLFVVDLATRNVSTLLVDATATDSGLGGVAVRKDGQGRIVGLYAGDLAGNLWRLDYNAQATSRFKVGNGGKPLFTSLGATAIASERQAILQPPLLVNHRKGGVLLVFGTGRLLTDADVSNSSAQAVYGIWDRDPGGASTGGGLTLRVADLVQRTLSLFKGTGKNADQTYVDVVGDPIDWATRSGWMVNLASLGDLPGLRVLQPVQLVRDRVAYVGPVAPGVAEQGCTKAAGTGINLMIPVDTGLASDKPFFDTNGDGAFNTDDRRALGYVTWADGVDSIVFGTVKSQPAAGDEGVPAAPTVPACRGSLVHLVGAHDSQAGCLSGANIVGRLWRRVMKAPF